MNFVLSSLSEGLLWSIVAIGVYLTFRILDIADITAEGAFPLGAAVVVSQIQAGANPWLATLLALLAGMVAGLVSGMLHTKMKIPALLTGIVTLTGLYSINIKIMGSVPNLSLGDSATVFKQLASLGLTNEGAVFSLSLACFLLVCLVLTLLMKTEIGLVLRSTGDNIPMSEANGVNVDTMKIVGYMISNGLIALCGSLFAQNDGFSDVTSGTGTIVVGLSSEVLIHDLTIGGRLLSIGIGAIVYRLIILNIYEIPNLDQNLVRLFNAILLALVLFAPELQKRLKIRGLKLRNE
ncbi:ABC transporter permease [Streptococcus pneumoniae]|uniref:ABC transporter permease n=2 Tax=Streptococcus pneumoniae TaxID=1313 RepID=A0A4J1UKB5_STREE|nr:ABC transporter permease [Streptococcus pneumoniae]MDS2425490.1 ABC transporter permease [Streptococcus pneumoniae]MDS2820240.1 ABC transporter permease [Streptococcus pneumoniae]MDS9474366.1 ABC transporter permease [Streptococcus pneumoniae]MDT5479741.1 ABC transporter permease [Streptococcus pneumoniae]MDT5484035.1 ABC transporter permease [Streptococcus pneumoniae]